MTLKLGLGLSQVGLPLTKRDNEQGYSQMLFTTKVSGGSEIQTFDRFGDRNLIRLISASQRNNFCGNQICMFGGSAIKSDCNKPDKLTIARSFV